MQILASALPGFRDLRAPLTAGYLWMVLLYVALKPDVTKRPTNEIASALYDLGKWAGPVWIGVAVSVSAYLVGSTTQPFSQPLSAAVRRIMRFGRKVRYDVVSTQVPDGLEAFPTIRMSELREIETLQRKAMILLSPPLLAAGKQDELKIMQRDVRLRAQEAERGLAFELSMPATLLVGNEPSLFSEADRLKAESQLRYAISLPLNAIALYLSNTQSLWWIAAFIPIAILIGQAYFREAEFRSLMLAAVQRGVIQSQSVEEFKFWVSNLPLDGKPPRAAQPKTDAENAV